MSPALCCTGWQRIVKRYKGRFQDLQLLGNTICTWGQLICLTNIAAIFKSSCKVESSGIPSRSFWFIVEASLINAWLLYKSSREAAMLPIEYTMFTFRKSIALALVAEWETMGCKNHTSTLSPTKSMQNPKTQSRTHLRKMKLNEGTRFPSPDLHLSFCTLSPLKEGSNLKVSQMRCQQCKERRSIYWCKECQAPLYISGLMFSEISHRRGLSSCRKRLKKHIFLATVYPYTVVLVPLSCSLIFQK